MLTKKTTSEYQPPLAHRLLMAAAGACLIALSASSGWHAAMPLVESFQTGAGSSTVPRVSETQEKVVDDGKPTVSDLQVQSRDK